MKRIYKGSKLPYTVNVGSYKGDFTVCWTNSDTSILQCKKMLKEIRNGVFKGVIDTSRLSCGRFSIVLTELDDTIKIAKKEMFLLTDK